ncbi:MAG TPA: beta-galactosidase [Galbitalea sp.]|jgi:beta-galactosidase|nr:beta-galactosidase [Galbitalea sp.]
MWFGGDYNPEQWSPDVWEEDVRLMQRAGVNVVTVGVFAWAMLEPSDGQFEFDWLDEVLGRLNKAGIKVFLATATASPPPWLVAAHPDILPVTATGVRLSGGSRQHYSPHSRTYRQYAARLVRELAQRYGSHPAIVAWHVNNEYGGHIARCYSDEGAIGFRAWLASRYGDIAGLNAAWGTTFWSQRYTSFAEIEPPRVAPTFINPTQLLDFERFSSDALLECYREELAILRELTPRLPVSTNFMGIFKPLDYWKWASEVDFICDDSYPDPSDPLSYISEAMTCDVMRGLGSGRGWILAEQATSAVNWRDRNVPKPPGAMRAKAFQAIARGANGIMFFQWRQSIFGSEKFHSAMLPHQGPNSRIFLEVEALGKELALLPTVKEERSDASVAIILDWDAWWALEQPGNPATIDYLANVRTWYDEFYRRNIRVDFVRAGSELARYSLVIVPHLFCASDDIARGLADYASKGGTMVVTYQSFILDDNLHIGEAGYLGPLSTVLGVCIEEFAPLALPDSTLSLSGPLVALGSATSWAEVIRVEGAEVLASFVDGDLSGRAAITRKSTGSGSAIYVATQLAQETMAIFVDELLTNRDVEPDAWQIDDEVETVRRGTTIFTIDHGSRDVTVRPAESK